MFTNKEKKMNVFIIKHHMEEIYVASNETPVGRTNDKDKAFRFGTRALADKCKGRMQIPITWNIIPALFENGNYVERSNG